MSDPGDETPDWPERLDRMEREVSGHGRECADDCVHPDHQHALYVEAAKAHLNIVCWRGKRVDDMAREELIDAVKWLARAWGREMAPEMARIKALGHIEALRRT